MYIYIEICTHVYGCAEWKDQMEDLIARSKMNQPHAKTCFTFVRSAESLKVFALYAFPSHAGFLVAKV